MGYCTYKDHKGDRKLPASRFGKYKSGNPKSQCRLCDSARAADYKKRMLSDPKTAAKFKAGQDKYAEEWRSRPGNKEKQKIYRREWYERNKDGESVKRARANYLARHPERVKAAQKRYREKVLADPKAHEAFLEQRRIEYHLRKERQGTKAGYLRGVRFREKETRVSTEPFVKWLKPIILSHEYSLVDVVNMTGLDHSGLGRIMSGTYKIMEIGTVDKVLTALGGPPYQSLYPDA